MNAPGLGTVLCCAVLCCADFYVINKELFFVRKDLSSWTATGHVLDSWIAVGQVLDFGQILESGFLDGHWTTQMSVPDKPN